MADHGTVRDCRKGGALHHTPVSFQQAAWLDGNDFSLLDLRMSVPSVQTLKQALSIAEEIQRYQAKLSGILGQVPSASKSFASSLVAATATAPARRKPKFSRAARARIAAAQKARWAKLKAGKGKESKPRAGKPKTRKKGKMSAAGRANIVKAQKARWAKVRAEKGKKN